MDESISTHNRKETKTKERWGKSLRKPQENHWLSWGCLIWTVQRRVRAVGGGGAYVHLSYMRKNTIWPLLFVVACNTLTSQREPNFCNWRRVLERIISESFLRARMKIVSSCFIQMKSISSIARGSKLHR